MRSLSRSKENNITCGERSMQRGTCSIFWCNGTGILRQQSAFSANSSSSKTLFHECWWQINSEATKQRKSKCSRAWSMDSTKDWTIEQRSLINRLECESDECGSSSHPADKPNDFLLPLDRFFDHFHPKQHLLTAKRYRQQMRQRLEDWRESVLAESCCIISAMVIV